MIKYLSIDTEATGLTEDCQMIQLAFVPVDVSKEIVREDLGWEILIKCPSFEELKPRLNDWVRANMEPLITKAHLEGVTFEECKSGVERYLKSKPICEFFGNERPTLMGKSMSALDIPLLKRSFSWEFFQKHFHHHTVDITCLAQAIVDAGLLPEGGASTTSLMRHFKIREEAEHTALQDAVDMGHIYMGLLQMIRKPA